MSTSIVPSKSIKRSLREAATLYHNQLPGSVAEDYLLSERKLTSEAVRYFQIGFVGDPAKGDEEFRGRISIPYLTPGGTVSIRFRACGSDQGGSKYLSRSGDGGRPYNVLALRSDVPSVYVTEGEIDAITCWMAGLPAVAIPGAQGWRSAYSRLFRWRQVTVLADGDEPGRRFAQELRNHIETCRIIDMGDGQDVNSVFALKGIDGLREMVGA